MADRNTKIRGNQILDGTITSDELASDSVITVKILDANVTEPKLDILNSPTTGYVLSWNGTKMEWIEDVSPVAEVLEADFVANEVANETPNGSITDFTHDNLALENSVQVFLNGLLQQPGVGKDYVYTVATKTASFVIAPATGDIVLFCYVKDEPAS